MIFKIEGSEFTIEEILHHISKGRSGHFKQIVIDALSKAGAERDELLAEVARLKDEEHKSGMLRVRVSKQIDALKEQLAKAEGERDELRASLISASKMQSIHRDACQKAEAELARRDAAASERVYQLWSPGIDVWVECNKQRYDEWAHMPAQRRILYTAAQPAVLPPAYEQTEDFGDYHLGWNSAIKEAIELGAQPQKVVDFSKCRTLWYDHDDLSAEVKCIPWRDVKAALDAANVKWEAK